MGPQRVLQAARRLTAAAVALGALGALGAGAPAARAAPGGTSRERVAVIDLGPVDLELRKQLHVAVVAAGLAVVAGDGIEDALAGQRVDRDELELAEALARAQRAFGALDCTEASAAAHAAAALAARRQAAGLAVPELERAWTYLLLCRDREGATDAAALAAARLRAVTGSSAPPAAVPADVWRRYPEVDTVLDRELVPLEITADVPGAAVWIDFRPAGTAPLTVMLPAGEHVIAVAAGTRRGWAYGTTSARSARSRSRPPTRPARTRRSPRASRRGAARCRHPPSSAARSTRPARVALVRHGDTLEVWGRVGRTARRAGSATTTASRRSPRPRACSRSRPIACRRGTTARRIPISRCSSRIAPAPRASAGRASIRRPSGGCTRRSSAPRPPAGS